MHISELAQHHVENPREIVEPGQDVRVKILEIDSERRRLSLSVKRVAEQLAHIKSAAAAGAAAAAVAEGELGDVPDLGLSEDVFAGPSVSGIDDLRAAVADFGSPDDAEEAPPLERPAEAPARAPSRRRGARGRGAVRGARRRGACRRGACRRGACGRGACRRGACRRGARGRGAVAEEPVAEEPSPRSLWPRPSRPPSRGRASDEDDRPGRRGPARGLVHSPGSAGSPSWD